MSLHQFELNSAVYRQIGWAGGTVTCDNVIYGCPKRLRSWQERQQHKDECEFNPYKIVKCDGCNLEMKRNQLKYHNCKNKNDELKDLEMLIKQTKASYDKLEAKVAENNEKLSQMKNDLNNIILPKEEIHVKKTFQTLNNKQNFDKTKSFNEKSVKNQRNFQTNQNGQRTDKDKLRLQIISSNTVPRGWKPQQLPTQLNLKYGINYVGNWKRYDKLDQNNNSPRLPPSPISSPIMKMSLKDFRRLYSEPENHSYKEIQQTKQNKNPMQSSPSPSPSSGTSSVDLSDESRTKFFNSRDWNFKPIVRIRSWSAREEDP